MKKRKSIHNITYDGYEGFYRFIAKMLDILYEMLNKDRIKNVCHSYKKYKNKNYLSIYTLRAIMGSGYEFRKLR